MLINFSQGSAIPSIRGACVQPCAILFIRFAEFKIQLRYLGLDLGIIDKRPTT